MEEIDIDKKKDLLKEILKVKNKTRFKTFSQTNFFKTQPKFFKRSSIRPEPFRFSKLTKYHRSKTKEKQFMEILRLAVDADKEAKKFKVIYERPEFTLGDATIGEIRKFLHPSCKKEFCPKKYH